MATLRMGILGDVKGKVGTVVGARWRAGKWTLRSYVKDVKNPRTDAQVLTRVRFATCGQLGSALLDAIDQGFKKILKTVPTVSLAEFVKLNWDTVQASNPDSVNVTYSDMRIAKGTLTPVQFGAPQFDTPQTVEVSFETNEGIGKAGLDDKVFLVVYCPDAKACVVGNTSKRLDKNVSCLVPNYWNGMKVHCWGFVVGDTPRKKNLGHVSNSVYIGSGNIG